MVYRFGQVIKYFSVENFDNNNNNNKNYYDNNNNDYIVDRKIEKNINFEVFNNETKNVHNVNNIHNIST
jgi:hypothetical protein